MANESQLPKMEVLGHFALTGQVALVTGAGKGIGAAIATVFAGAGADVALVARTSEDLEAVARRVEEVGGRAIVLPADLNDLAQLALLVDRTVDELGRLDVLVNNAGGSVSHFFSETRVAELEAAFHFNASVTFELSRLAVPHMLTHGGGCIVNIGSVVSRKASRGTLTHGTTKAAVAHLTRLMAADLAPRVRVNAVLPGAIETASLGRVIDAMGEDIRATMIERTPMRRNGTPEDIAFASLFLASPAASWITGKLLEVDGAAADDLIPKEMPDL
jgi:7-alpha-hydroxysteroid dehydrogenase